MNTVEKKYTKLNIGNKCTIYEAAQLNQAGVAMEGLINDIIKLGGNMKKNWWRKSC